ncbi:hypothetical protein M4D68_09680 [Priestia aryabhattai]|uniref:hypothetical protein n=1 Tax=Priestia aryabhattai TaxID=412384 RepID=UPI0020417A0F|nr:hypothetical protein [Priestia aryabhattai]MCM3641406.1 hypothetical protein [Priestia aryabhattai]
MNKEVTCNEIKVVYGRQRAFLNGELVGLSCKDCKQLLPLEKFGESKACFAGKRNKCRSCDRKKASEWRKNNHKKYLERMKNYRKETPHKYLASKQNSRAKQHGTEDKLTPEHVDILLGSAGYRTEQGEKQVRCQLTGIWTSNYDTCHVHPLRAGGHSENGNLFFATRQVNALQGNLHLFEWLLTERAQELVLPEYVEWLLIDLSHRNMKDLYTMLANVVGYEGANKLIELYF